MDQAVSIISAIVVLLSAALSAWLTRRNSELARRATYEERALRYREPLLQAAFNLQTRLFNIAQRDLLTAFVHRGTPREREYAIETPSTWWANTVGWVEIIRREAQFMDPVNLTREG
jgi:hypothetical protein